jgi:hypothetical protein
MLHRFVHGGFNREVLGEVFLEASDFEQKHDDLTG